MIEDHLLLVVITMCYLYIVLLIEKTLVHFIGPVTALS